MKGRLRLGGCNEASGEAPAPPMQRRGEAARGAPEVLVVRVDPGLQAFRRSADLL
jgi:hypothetical protein